MHGGPGGPGGGPHGHMGGPPPPPRRRYMPYYYRRGCGGCFPGCFFSFLIIFGLIAFGVHGILLLLG